MQVKLIFFIVQIALLQNVLCAKRVKRIVGGVTAAPPPIDDPVVFIRHIGKYARVEGLRFGLKFSNFYSRTLIFVNFEGTSKLVCTLFVGYITQIHPPAQIDSNVHPIAGLKVTLMQQHTVHHVPSLM
jgi:hypothetical protein